MMTISSQKLSKSDRERLAKEIEKMEMFDELTYCIEYGNDFNNIIKLNNGYLFKAKYTDNYVYIAGADFV